MSNYREARSSAQAANEHVKIIKSPCSLLRQSTLHALRMRRSHGWALMAPVSAYLTPSRVSILRAFDQGTGKDPSHLIN